jgi:tetratricopeptide (TPR) repeat protein
LFETREGWLAHERSHRYEWLCDDGHSDVASVLIFSTEEEFKHHLLRDHSESVTERLIPFLIDTQKRPSLFPFKYCPFGDTPDGLDLRKIEDLYKVDDDKYIHLERSERLQKHIALHLRNLSTLAWLESNDDCADSVGDTTVSKWSRGKRSDNLSYISTNVCDEVKSSQFPTDKSYDRVSHEVPGLDNEVNWALVREQSFPLENSPLPEADPCLASFVERYILQNQGHFLMPYPRNSLFIGRDDLLSRLRQKLEETDSKHHNHRVAIYGMGGVGKTQIAVEYVYRNRYNYDNIYWINGLDEAELSSGFQEIAALTELSAQIGDLNSTEVTAHVLYRLGLQQNWLLVIDNLDNFSVADGFLPARHDGGHILITTRSPHVQQIPAEGLEIPVLREEEAVHLLLTHSAITDTDLSSHKSEILSLVNELGHLPLAVAHAANFIRSLSQGFAEFLPIYQKSRKEVLLSRATLYPSSFATTLFLSLEKVKETKNGVQAIKFLQFLVFLNPDEILIDFLLAGSQGLSDEIREIVDGSALHSALDLLEHFSLIRRTQRKDAIAFQIHRLIQAFVLDQLSEEEANKNRREVIGICSAAFPESWETMETRAVCRKFQNQVVEPAFNAAAMPSRDAGIILQRIGLFLSEEGEYKDSERLNVRCYETCQVVLGDEHPDTLTSMSNLAVIYWHQGKLQEASDLGERVLEARRRVLGVEHPDTLTSMSNLASLYQHQGKLQKASDLGERVLEARRRVLGEEHPDTLMSMSLLAWLYVDLGQTTAAKILMQQAAESSKRTLGEHPYTVNYERSLEDIIRRDDTV